MPIETLQQGDTVLSPGETPGERVPRRVLRSSVQPGQHAVCITYELAGGGGATLTAGPEHLFWSEAQGWAAATSFAGAWSSTVPLLLLDGSGARVLDATTIMATDRPHVGWLAFGGREAVGTLWDYGANALVANGVKYDAQAWGAEHRPFQTALYNLEIEDLCGYFAGLHGVCAGSAQPGDPASMHAFGLRLLQGRDAPQDARAGYEWLTRAADAGHAGAQSLVGAMSKEPVKAVRYLRMAAEQGDGRAQFLLALHCEEGRGVEHDVQQAMHWYQKAMAQGNMAAHYNVGRLWSFAGSGIHDPDTDVQWFRARAAEADAVAQWVSGICHESGSGGAQVDPIEAVRCFQLAAAQGFGPAICKLAGKYEEGISVQQDPAQALVLYHQAALLNVAAAMEGLAAMHRDGRGVPRDPVQAMLWFRKAAAAGSEQARSALKRMPEGDFCKATELLAMAQRSGGAVQLPPRLLWDLGNRVLDPDDAETLPLAFGLYLHAARQGHLEAQSQAALRYLHGLGVEKDSQQAAAWYLKAAEAGEADAQAALGALFETGTGVQEDAAQAKRWYERAAGQGHHEAQFKLGLRSTRGPTLADLGIDTGPEKRRWWQR